jgi:ribosome-binding ATPase YchF (GTP1/OBG family)
MRSFTSLMSVELPMLKAKRQEDTTPVSTLNGCVPRLFAGFKATSWKNGALGPGNTTVQYKSNREYRGSVKRRHTAIKGNAVDTLQGQFSGYGSTKQIVARTLDKLELKEALEHWSDETVEKVVNAFVDEKFPTVIALNKIDHPDADKNVAKIARLNDPNTLVLCSAISEVFLRRLAKQGFVKYTEGSEFVDTREDLIENGEPDGGGLKELDEKLQG